MADLRKMTRNEMLKEYKKEFKKIERSMKAREKMNDWRYTIDSSYQIFKELESISLKGIARSGLISALKGLEQIQERGYTKKDVEQFIKKNEENFIKNNYDNIKRLLEKEGGRGEITDRMIQTRAKDIAKDKDYYNYLHSDTYKKLTEHYKIESGDLIRDYIMNKENALEHYEKYLDKVEKQEDFDGELELKQLLLENPFED